MSGRKRKKQIEKAERERVLEEKENYDIVLERVIHFEFFFGKIILEKVINNICSTWGDYIPTEEEIKAVSTMFYGFAHYVDIYLEDMECEIRDEYIKVINIWGHKHIKEPYFYYEIEFPD